MSGAAPEARADTSSGGQARSGDTLGQLRAWMTRERLLVAAALVAIFAVSVFVRLGHLGEPMGIHHEEGTARVLLHSTVWWEEGPSGAGFLLRKNLTSPGDAYLAPPGPLTDGDGNTYYASMPPGHPLWMFLAHRVVGVEPTVMSVRYVNLAVNLLCAALVYLVVREILRGLPDGWSRTAGLVAAATYLFAPVTLWFQSNAWTSASAVQPFFIAAIWAVARAYRDEERQRLFVVLTGALVFGMSYTEWLGPAFALATVVLAVIRRRSDALIRRIAVASAIGAVLALGLTFLQYSTISGAGEMARLWLGRYQMRSGFGEASVASPWNRASWIRLLGQYIDSLAPAFAVLAIVFVWDRILAGVRGGKFRAGGAPVSVVMTLALAPVLIHHVVLFDHAVIHDFDMLKMTVFVSVATGLLVGRLIARYAAQERPQHTMAVAVVCVLVVVSAYASVRLYDWLNPSYAAFERIGTAIARTAEPDEVVFLVPFDYMPPSVVTHYAGRNWVPWPGEDRAPAVLGRGGADRRGVVFGADLGRGVFEVWYVAPDGSLHPTREEAMAATGDVP